MFTTVKKHIIPDGKSSHPWTFNKEYDRVIKARRNVKRITLNSPSDFNNALLRLANINVSFVYNQLRSKYYDEMFNYIGNDPSKFYRLMSTKRQQTKSLPIIMKYNNVSLKGDNRYRAIEHNLQSCFIQSNVHISPFDDIARKQFHKLYFDNTNDSSHTIWLNSTRDFTLEDVMFDINKLDDKKDPDPMSITATFIKFNKQLLGPQILIIFNSIIRNGFFRINELISNTFGSQK